MFEIMEKELKQLGIKYFKLTGSTKVEERLELVNEFNENPEIKVFLISLKAGGTRTKPNRSRHGNPLRSMVELIHRKPGNR